MRIVVGPALLARVQNMVLQPSLAMLGRRKSGLSPYLVVKGNGSLQVLAFARGRKTALILIGPP